MTGCKEDLIAIVARTIEPKFSGFGKGDLPRQIAYEVASEAVASLMPLLGPLVSYISPDDVDLTREAFLRAVADRINDDLASKARQSVVVEREDVPLPGWLTDDTGF
jgi:hypothetical protein